MDELDEVKQQRIQVVVAVDRCLEALATLAAERYDVTSESKAFAKVYAYGEPGATACDALEDDLAHQTGVQLTAASVAARTLGGLFLAGDEGAQAVVAAIAVLELHAANLAALRPELIAGWGMTGYAPARDLTP